MTDIVDLFIRIRGKTLPINYAHTLAEALTHLIIWSSDSRLGMQITPSIEEGNGWHQGTATDDSIYLPRRARLVLRLPKDKVDAAQTLSGTSLNLESHQLSFLNNEVKPLTAWTHLYARHIVSDNMSEAQCIESIRQELDALNVTCDELLCGKGRSISTPNGTILTRSLLLIDLKLDDSIKIQAHGIGPHRQLGCGFFVPHKTI